MSSFVLDKKEAITCLDELESEYLRIGSAKCDYLGSVPIPVEK